MQETRLDPWVGKIPLGKEPATWSSCLGNPMGREAWWVTVHSPSQSLGHSWATKQQQQQQYRSKAREQLSQKFLWGPFLLFHKTSYRRRRKHLLKWWSLFQSSWVSFFELKAEEEITAPWAPFWWGLPKFQVCRLSPCLHVEWWGGGHPAQSSSLAEGQLLHEMRRWVKPLPPLASGSSQHREGTCEKNMFILNDLKYLFNIITSYSRNASIHLPPG